MQPLFMGLGAPGRNYSPLVIVTVGIDDRDLHSVYYPNGVNAPLSIVEAVVDSFDGRTLENPHCIFERDPMQWSIPPVLCPVPSVTDKVYLHNVNTHAVSTSQLR